MWYIDCHNELTLVAVMDQLHDVEDKGQIRYLSPKFLVLIRKIYRLLCVEGLVNFGVYRRSPRVLLGACTCIFSEPVQQCRKCLHLAALLSLGVVCLGLPQPAI